MKEIINSSDNQKQKMPDKNKKNLTLQKKQKNKKAKKTKKTKCNFLFFILNNTNPNNIT